MTDPSGELCHSVCQGVRFQTVKRHTTLDQTMFFNAATEWICLTVPCLSLSSVFVRRSTQIKTYSWDNAQVVLAGNKCDMEEERVVSVDSGRMLAEQLGED